MTKDISYQYFTIQGVTTLSLRNEIKNTTVEIDIYNGPVYYRIIFYTYDTIPHPLGLPFKISLKEGDEQDAARYS